MLYYLLGGLLITTLHVTTVYPNVAKGRRDKGTVLAIIVVASMLARPFFVGLALYIALRGLLRW